MSATPIETPFVIWTLQRTGGTNLSRHLNLLSRHEKLQDEPFNLPREYGHLTKAWKADKDKDALKEAMAPICASQKNMKHCVEQVPWAISEALVFASAEAGYAPIFLYRENPLQRLLSMEYAKRTKSWGPKSAAQAQDDDEAFVAPLDVDSLIEHETNANNKLNKIWRLLRRADAAPVAISYEELYSADAAVTRKVLKRVFARLGVEATSEQLEDAIRSSGDQQTRDRYEKFKGIEDLQKRIDALPQLFFSRQAQDDRGAAGSQTHE